MHFRYVFLVKVVFWATFMCFQVQRAYDIKDGKLEFLEPNGAWCEKYMLGTQGWDEIEDLKIWGFLVQEGFLVQGGVLIEERFLINERVLIEEWFLINEGFLVEDGFLEEWRFLLKQGFLLEVGKLSLKVSTLGWSFLNLNGLEF